MIANRCVKNPIITAADIKPSRTDFEVVLVFNPGAIMFNGKTLLLLRVAERVKGIAGKIGVPVYNKNKNDYDIIWFNESDPECDFSDVRFVKKGGELYLTTISSLTVATSQDGINFTVESKPLITGDNMYESFGAEDARITKLGGWYYINYSGISSYGVCTMLCKTRDFKTVKKLGVQFLPDNKDITVFPKKIGGKFWALNRPVSDYFKKPMMWISSGSSINQLGNHKFLLGLRDGCFDSARIGASCVPILTKSGWLEIYHGCDKNDRYCLGAVLLDKDDPSKVIKRCNAPILQPQHDYEKQGFMPEVVFSCGAIAQGDTVRVYYGACDAAVCLATFSIAQILDSLV